MRLCRPLLTYFFAASYALVAIVVGGGHPFLHDHGCAEHQTPSHVAAHDHHHHDHEAVEAGEHDHDHDAPDHSCPHHHHDDGHGCVVCHYLAQQPLPVVIETPPALSQSCEALAVMIPLGVCSTPLLSHPARGPPLSA